MLLSWLKFRKRQISARELHRKMASRQKFTIIDVRTEPEYNGPDGRIPGAILVPIREFREKGRKIVSSSKNPVIIYCSHGLRSLYAMNFTDEKESLSLKGGIREWNRQGFETIVNKDAGKVPVPSRKEC